MTAGTWIVALSIIGIVAVLAYRVYFNPPLSKQGKIERERYLHLFRYGRTLVYQMSLDQAVMLRLELKSRYRSVGTDNFYGNNAMIQLQSDFTEMTLRVFCPTEELLSKNLWMLMQIKRTIEEAYPNGSYG